MRPLRLFLAAALVSAAFTGCVAPQTLNSAKPAANPPPPPPEPANQVVLPGRIVSNLLFVQGTVEGAGPFWFLIDTGSSTTLVSDRVAAMLKDVRTERGLAPVQIISAAGGATLLGSTSLPSLELGSAKFENVKAAVFDFADLSNHLGLTVDGIIGFPVFRDLLLTLDYPNSRVVLAPRFPARPMPGSAVPFAVEEGARPLVNLTLSGTPVTMLIDSGSDLALTLNPTGLTPKFKFGPRNGPIVATLSGNTPQQIGRLADTLALGEHEVREPRVMLTDQQSSIGGAILRNFSVTFDQRRGIALFAPSAKTSVRLPSLRSTGLSFIRLTTEWRVIQVLDDVAPVTKAIRPGDVLLSIDGEAVKFWNLERFEQHLRTHKTVTLALRRADKTFDVRVPVFDLVP